MTSHRSDLDPPRQMSQKSLSVASHLFARLLLTLSVVYSQAGCRSAVDPEGSQIQAEDARLSIVSSVGSGSLADDAIVFGRVIFGSDDGANIYVADVMLMQIWVFDMQLNHVGIFGRRGQGPSEFQRMTASFPHPSGEGIYVLDNMNRRLTHFSAKENESEIIEVPASLKASSVRSWGQQFVVAQYYPKSTLFASEKIVHLLSSNLNTALASYFSISELLPSVSEPEEWLFRSHPGFIDVDENGTIYYAPYAYSGTVYGLEKESNGYRRFEMDGYLENELLPYSVQDKIEFGDLRQLQEIEPRMNFSIMGYDFVMNNQSLGLFVGPRQILYHFTFTRCGDARCFGVESFDLERRILTKYQLLEKKPLTRYGTAYLNKVPLGINAEGNFYFTNRSIRDFETFDIARLEAQ